LLRAVRERSARDAVRSALERLTGNNAAAPADSPAMPAAEHTTGPAQKPE
jgi:hypothetical protein